MRGFTRRLLFPLLALLVGDRPLRSREPNRNIRFGLPSAAPACDPRNHESYLVKRPQYVLLSYNNRTHTPNWVCWQLRKDDIGKAQPRTHSSPDPAACHAPRLRAHHHARLRRLRLRPRTSMPGPGPFQQPGRHGQHLLPDERAPPVARLESERLGAARKLLPSAGPRWARFVHLLRPARDWRRGQEWPQGSTIGKGRMEVVVPAPALEGHSRPARRRSGAAEEHACHCHHHAERPERRLRLAELPGERARGGEDDRLHLLPDHRRRCRRRRSRSPAG